MANGKELISDELLHQVEEAAHAQNREPSDLVAEAVRKYLDDLSWVQFVERNGAKASRSGIKEEDVDRLISEVRRETASVDSVLRVTADTNIIVSGLNFPGSKPFRFLDLARAGKINLTVSDAILDEMEDVLGRKFPLSAEEIAEARRRIKAMARTVTPHVKLDVVKEDPPDDRILECAVAAGSDYIVTGDKDLLRLKSYDSIRILSVSDFLELVQAQGRRI